MQKYFGIITIVSFILLVQTRTLNLKKQGINALEFGKKDKKDFLILPFALFYFYIITANVFNLPTIKGQILFQQNIISWIGVAFCLIALLLFLWTMISFKKSFRVGLVENSEQGLITTGSFAISRNPIYVSFAIMLIGQFLIFPSWILMIYIFLGILTFNRQVLKEEKFLIEQYGDEFSKYCKKVRRYL
ncbi:isoprenylcysteine carboxylmethyltransferase family protein [Odoribacter sp. OttesenSCG-928-L07]|nr:isoprenylcysteine carboxylmethyltransferase family protein [Odoribacter sp. OttesenSCG-928-L07]MDL2239208.1 isoprenylcysteine carboxylmethyltransferase family protein [Bacteroidales bacterium OttesenSCG-928-L14]MDL2240552.1 isoprenylcysteine carboxylmethyltransferase family protein [Bacteroidales bacterium OttesenSCG-928-K22]